MLQFFFLPAIPRVFSALCTFVGVCVWERSNKGIFLIVEGKIVQYHLSLHTFLCLYKCGCGFWRREREIKRKSALVTQNQNSVLYKQYVQYLTLHYWIILEFILLSYLVPWSSITLRCKNHSIQECRWRKKNDMQMYFFHISSSHKEKTWLRLARCFLVFVNTVKCFLIRLFTVFHDSFPTLALTTIPGLLHSQMHAYTHCFLIKTAQVSL